MTYKTYTIIFCLLISKTSFADLEVPDKKDQRVLSDDSNITIDSEYKRLYDQLLNSTTGIYDEIDKLKQENEKLKANNSNQAQVQRYSSPASISSSLGNEVSGNQKSPRNKPTSSAPTRRLKSGIQVFAVTDQAKENLTMLPAGSFVRAKVLTGVKANAKYPYNVLLELEYAYMGPNNTRIPLQGCRVVAGATSDLSIERVILSPHTLSCVRENGEYIQRKIDGFVAGRDSENGMEGEVDNKQDKVFFQAMLAGIVQGASQAYKIANTQQQLVPTNDGNAAVVTNFKGKFEELALALGLAKPAEMVTSWYLEQAKALLPTIRIVSGDDVWIIMTDSVDVPDLKNFEQY